MTYDSGHVAPFVADALAVSPSDATIGYVGANPVLERMLAAAVAELWFENPLQAARLDDLNSVEELLGRADVVVVDLGIDAAEAYPSLSPLGEHQPARLPPQLYGAFDVLERLVDVEREHLERGERARRFVLVHSWTVFWNGYVIANFDCSHTTAHSRVRRATVRRVPADDGATRSALSRERLLLRWATRGEVGRHRLLVPVGGAVEPGHLRDYGGFGEGWSFPEEGGIWTQGSRSELAVALEGAGDGDYVLALSLGSICVEPDGSLRARVLVNGKGVVTRRFSYGDPEWHIEMPSSASANEDVDLSLEIEEPRTPVDVGWSLDDQRPLGLLLRAVTLLPADADAARAGLDRERRHARWAARRKAVERRVHVRIGEAVVLTDLSDYGAFGDGWVFYSQEMGIWTEGSRSELAVTLDGIGESDYVLALSLGSICVASDASLRVEAHVNGERVAARDFSYGDPEWRIELPAPVPAEVDLAFVIEEPNSPVEVGWSADDRRLGIRLGTVRLEELDRSVRSGERVLFAEGSGAERLLGEGWSFLEPTGVWTDGEQASLVLKLTDLAPAAAELVLAVSAFVTAEYPELKVEVSALDEQLAGRVFRHGEGQRLLRVPFPSAAGAQGGRIPFELHFSDPARPVDLGLDNDARRLGLHLEWLMVRKSVWRTAFSDVIREKSSNLRRRMGR